MSSLFYWSQQGQHINACFMDYMVKTVSAPDAHKAKREELIAQSMDPALLSQYRSLGGNLYQVISTTHQTIESIYQQLPVGNSVCLVPYGLAIMALLQDKRIDLSRLTVFIDYQAQNVWVSIFDKGLFNAPRSIQGMTHDQIKLEVERSVKNYEQNNDQYQDQSDEVQIITNQELGLDHPAQEALKLARFDMHFDLPQRIVAAKRQAFWLKKLIYFSISLCVVCFGIAGGGYTWKKHLDFKHVVVDLERKIDKKKAMLSILQEQKIFSLIQKMYKPNYQLLYQQTSRDAPLGCYLSDLKLMNKSDDHWSLTAVYTIDNRKYQRLSNLVLKDKSLRNYRFLTKDEQQKLVMSFDVSKESKFESRISEVENE